MLISGKCILSGLCYKSKTYKDWFLYTTLYYFKLMQLNVIIFFVFHKTVTVCLWTIFAPIICGLGNNLLLCIFIPLYNIRVSPFFSYIIKCTVFSCSTWSVLLSGRKFTFQMLAYSFVFSKYMKRIVGVKLHSSGGIMSDFHNTNITFFRVLDIFSLNSCFSFLMLIFSHWRESPDMVFLRLVSFLLFFTDFVLVFINPSEGYKNNILFTVRLFRTNLNT